MRVQVLARDKYRCLMCGRGKDEVALEVDHVIPVATGGTDELENLATLCRDCNRGKSAYRFSDYRNMNVVPEELQQNFKFFHDQRPGDFERFHLYLYYKNGTHPGTTDAKFHYIWTIPGTSYDTSSDQAALVKRRREEEEVKFLAEIKRQLILEGKRLIINEEGICKVNG
jgi:hypothetical protein